MARKRRDNTYGPAGMPDLPNPLDDNRYLASATQAAEMDRLSGAYDEFLFSENGLDQMPYERAVDDHLSLVKKRLEDRGRRSVLVEEHKLIDAGKNVLALTQKHDHVLAEMKRREEDLAFEQMVLNGEALGRHNLKWPGKAPEMTSMPSAFIRLMIPYALFVVVGLVDIYIMYLSFHNTLGNKNEAIFFILPAVAVQLVFPHLIGDRIALWKQGYRPGWILATQILIMAIIWIGFVIAVTAIRYAYLKTLDASLTSLQLLAIYLSSLIMLLALGLWLLLVGMNANPHERAFARFQFAIERLKRRSLKISAEITKATAIIPMVEASLEVARSGYEDAISASQKELVEAAKSVYRRALVNMTGDVQFTNAYLTSPSSRRSEVSREIKKQGEEPKIRVGWRRAKSEIPTVIDARQEENEGSRDA